MNTTKSKDERQRDAYFAATAAALEADEREVGALRPPPIAPSPPPDPRDLARNLREVGPAAAFFGAMSDFYGKKIDLVAYKVMLDEMVRDLGDPTDPLQRMLAEQLVIAHHVCGRLQARAAMQENCNNMDIFLRGAVRMMTEFRKHATVFSELRSKMPSQRSANAERNLESPNPGAAVDAEPKRFADGELVSKPGSGTVSNAA